MNKDEQRLAIAEACGWTNFQTTAPQRGSLEPRVFGYNGKHNITRIIPDYLNDLNAMHEAEKSCIKGGCEELYLGHLGFTDNDWEHEIFNYVTATASQRAEAFLKTVGKWVE